MRDVRRQRIPSLWSRVRELRTSANGFSFNMGDASEVVRKVCTQ